VLLLNVHRAPGRNASGTIAVERACLFQQFSGKNLSFC
jgi:hypothetical protein